MKVNATGYAKLVITGVCTYAGVWALDIFRKKMNTSKVEINFIRVKFNGGEYLKTYWRIYQFYFTIQKGKNTSYPVNAHLNYIRTILRKQYNSVAQ